MYYIPLLDSEVDPKEGFGSDEGLLAHSLYFHSLEENSWGLSFIKCSIINIRLLSGVNQPFSYASSKYLT